MWKAYTQLKSMHTAAPSTKLTECQKVAVCESFTQSTLDTKIFKYNSFVRKSVSWCPRQNKLPSSGHSGYTLLVTCCHGCTIIISFIFKSICTSLRIASWFSISITHLYFLSSIRVKEINEDILIILSERLYRVQNYWSVRLKLT